MTMTRCLSCGEDVHITHSTAECPGDAQLEVPDGLQEHAVEPRGDA